MIGRKRCLSLVPQSKGPKAYSVPDHHLAKACSMFGEFPDRQTNEWSILEYPSDDCHGCWLIEYKKLKLRLEAERIVMGLPKYTADNPFLICLPPFGEGDKTCYRPSTHYTVWNSCDRECKNDQLEFAVIADSHTWLDITLKLLRQGDVYWIAASRKTNNWYWSNGTSLSSQLLENVHSENNGNCLSLNVTKGARSLQSRNCQEYSLCLCQEYQRGVLTTSPSSTFKPTTQQYVITSDRLTSPIPTTRSLQTPYSIKVSTVNATTAQQSATTIVINHTKFCKSTFSGNMCYYYYRDLLNKSDAMDFCKRLEKEMFHFDNDDATEQFVQETLKNIDGGIWLGAVKRNTDWIWLNGRTFTNAWTNSIFSTDTAYENSSCLIMVPSIQTLARMGCQKIFSVLCQDTSSTSSASPTQTESKVATAELAVVATTTETTTKVQPGSTTVNYDSVYALVPPFKSVQTLYTTKTVTEITSAKNEQSGTTPDKHEIYTTSRGSTFVSTSDASNDGFKWQMTSIQTTSKTSAGISNANSRQSGNVSGNPFPIFMHGVEEGDKTYFISSKQQMSWDLCTKYCKSFIMEFAIIPNNNTWINLVLRLVSYGGIYWVAACRNATEWRWVNETSLSQRFLRQFTLGNHGDCLSLDLPRNPNSLQPRPCLEKHFCLCQKYLRSSDNSATSMGSQVVTSTQRVYPSYFIKTSTSPIKSV